MSSRIVPVYIDLTTGKYVVRTTEVDENYQIYTVDVNTPSNIWTIRHNRNTKSVIVKAFINDEEVFPEIEITTSNIITATFTEEVTGTISLMVYNIDSYVPPPSPTVTPSVTHTPDVSMTPTVTPTPTPTP